MIELIVGTYGFVCWLVFKKFRLVPITTYTVCTAILGGIVMLFSLFILLSVCHPVSHDGRFYATVTQIVPQVRGVVTEVPVTPNKPLREGDVLFRIDPRPYQLDVDRLQAMLAGLDAKAHQLDAKLAATQAATAAARSNLLVSESEYDRQARIAVASAQAQIDQTQSRLSLANAELARAKELAPSGSISKQELESAATKSESLSAELKQSKNALQAANEKLESGANRLVAVKESLKQAEASELEAKIAFEAESDGMNPDVRQAMAELERKRWDLEQTTVRAPTDGYATFVSMRPGQMATPFSAAASMLFVPSEKRFLVASFPQNAIPGIEEGLEAELAFQAYPGQIFQAKVLRVQGIIHEGQITGNGQIGSPTSAAANDDIPVFFEYGDDVEKLNLPTGSQVSIAVYTHHFHALSLVRKIILRIKSWENYAFFMKKFDSLH